MELVVIQMGFESLEEFNSLVANVDLSTAEKIKSFNQWKEEDGTKAGLLKLYFSVFDGLEGNDICFRTKNSTNNKWDCTKERNSCMYNDSCNYCTYSYDETRCPMLEDEVNDVEYEKLEWFEKKVYIPIGKNTYRKIDYLEESIKIEIIKVSEDIQENIISDDEKEYNISVTINEQDDKECCYVSVNIQGNEDATLLLFSDMKSRELDYDFTDEEIILFTSMVKDYQDSKKV